MVSKGLGRNGIRGKTLTVKIKYHDFRQITRSRSYQDYFNDPETILNTSLDVAAGVFKPGDRIRLLGITLSNLENVPGMIPEEDRDQLSFDFN